VEIIRIPRIMQDTCRKHLLKGRSTGLVPTMGALHDGHLSLLKRAKMENDVVAASIFVNPIQFGPSEDLDKYPRDSENDIGKMRELEVDVLFLPDSSLVYPKSFATYVQVDRISEKLCGGFRPGHFRGVATVVAKLLNIAHPTRAYFGQKDFQQTVVIRRMAKDLNFDTEIVVCPTLREHDGLAMSSRNRYLDAAQRDAAASLYRSLRAGSDAISAGERLAIKIKELMTGMLLAEKLITAIDYASVYDPESLDEVTGMQGEVLLAVAVRLGETRLIDNMLVNVK
jgi:pantoate--beta-alanine ligase